MTLIEKQALNENVKRWFIAKDMHKQDPLKQIAKLYEEVNELHQAIIYSDEFEVEDALGDIQVVLIGLGLQLDLDLGDCLQSAYDVIKHRTGKLVNGIWVKDNE